MTAEYSLQSFVCKNTISFTETMPAQWAAMPNRHISAMLRTVDKCLEASIPMIKYEKCKWNVYDPDEILTKTRSGFDESQFSLRKGDIWPRDDLMYFKHKEKPYTVDFGYHGDVFEPDGYWLIYVINHKLEEPWEDPVERHEATSFLLAVEKVQSIVQKYT